MPRKPPRPRKTSDPEQHKRFITTAREVEVDESPDAFDRAFKKVMGRPRKNATQKPPVRSQSPQKRDGERSR
jgi:hypothetical protein